MSELKECPFCGSGEVRILKCHANWGHGYHVTCQRCLGVGPTGYSDRFKDDEAMKRYAADAWNRRTEPNKALTLEELEQMVGEPIYIYDPALNYGKWGINLGMNAVQLDGQTAPYSSMQRIGMQFYRHKPEGSEGE